MVVSEICENRRIEMHAVRSFLIDTLRRGFDNGILDIFRNHFAQITHQRNCIGRRVNRRQNAMSQIVMQTADKTRFLL